MTHLRPCLLHTSEDPSTCALCSQRVADELRKTREMVRELMEVKR